MIDGFSLNIEQYCAYCPEFRPELEQTDISRLDDYAYRYQNEIFCVNRKKCRRIYSNMIGAKDA